MGSLEDRRIRSDRSSKPPAIPFLLQLKHTNSKLAQNYKAEFDTEIGAHLRAGISWVCPCPTSRWRAGLVLASWNSVCQHQAIINSFPPLPAACSQPPALRAPPAVTLTTLSHQASEDKQGHQEDRAMMPFPVRSPACPECRHLITRPLGLLFDTIPRTN